MDTGSASTTNIRYASVSGRVALETAVDYIADTNYRLLKDTDRCLDENEWVLVMSKEFYALLLHRECQLEGASCDLTDSILGIPFLIAEKELIGGDARLGVEVKDAPITFEYMVAPYEPPKVTPPDVDLSEDPIEMYPVVHLPYGRRIFFPNKEVIKIIKREQERCVEKGL